MTQYGKSFVRVKKTGRLSVFQVCYSTDDTDFLAWISPIRMVGKVTRVDHYHSDPSYTGKVSLAVVDADGIDHLMSESSFPANETGTIEIRSGKDLPVYLFGDFSFRIRSESLETYGKFEIFVLEP